jgi:hypothetical protein
MIKEAISELLLIVTDRDIGLINAIEVRFPASRHLLCRWYINMNILAKTKGFFPKPVRVNRVIQRAPQFQEFLRSWNTLLASPNILTYN